MEALFCCGQQAVSAAGQSAESKLLLSAEP